MTDFILKQLPYDLSNQTGLALIGKYLGRINFNTLVDRLSRSDRASPSAGAVKESSVWLRGGQKRVVLQSVADISRGSDE